MKVDWSRMREVLERQSVGRHMLIFSSINHKSW